MPPLCFYRLSTMTTTKMISALYHPIEPNAGDKNGALKQMLTLRIEKKVKKKNNYINERPGYSWPSKGLQTGMSRSHVSWAESSLESATPWLKSSFKSSHHCNSTRGNVSSHFVSSPKSFKEMSQIFEQKKIKILQPSFLPSSARPYV